MKLNSELGKLKQKLTFLKRIPIVFFLYRLVFHRKYFKKQKDVFQQLVEIEKILPDEICHMQKDRLAELLTYAQQHTIYYRKIFDEHHTKNYDSTSLKKIPILTKDIIRKNISDLLSNEFDVNSLIKRNTGGSTGEPLEFYSDKMSGHIDYAHHWYLYSLMGYKKGDVIVGAGGTYIPKKLRNKNIFWLKDKKTSVWGEYDFSVLYITDSNVKYYVEKILQIKPSILRGYPSFFDKLATYILQNEIALDFEVKGINLTAEMCSVEQRQKIEKAFSCMVYFEYGHTEICLYCYTSDKTYIYKSSPLYGYIEVLNDEGDDVEIGEIGNIIVTGFNNYGMPFIRYDTGDIGELLYRNGGEVHFKKIHGRSQDFIISKDYQKVYLTALIFGQHLRAFKNIIQWQLEQNIAGEVIIKIIRNEEYSSEDELEIIKNFQSVAEFELIFEYVDDIPLTKRGKHLFLLQNIES